MIKTILWDFDGVIIDSMKIKGDGFVELFNNHDKQDLLSFEKFHYENGGVSRFDKIKYFYSEIIKKSINESQILEFANKFSEIIEKKLNNKDNLIKETIDFIKINYSKYNFHIVSGAEHNELNRLCCNLDLKKYFITINGSPIRKSILVKNILNKYFYKNTETVLIGDAISDYNASTENNILFYGYNNISLKKFGNYIDSFNIFKIR